MKEKINIAELLKDCPSGIELDCLLYDNCTYEGIEDNGYIDILINTPSGRIRLTKEGRYIRHDDNAKCVIFPKGKTTWEGFIPPYEFKDGDIVATLSGDWIGITTGGKSGEFMPTYCIITGSGKFEAYFGKKETWQFHRLATKEEKQRIFDAIKDNGYLWNAETKTLEKLVINKFDITTLKPFDKVLVRNTNKDYWEISMFGHISNHDKQYFMCIANSGFYQCVPYNDETKHLLDTTNDCDEFYKTW